MIYAHSQIYSSYQVSFYFFEVIPILLISTVSLVLIVSHEIVHAVYILSRNLGVFLWALVHKNFQKNSVGSSKIIFVSL